MHQDLKAPITPGIARSDSLMGLGYGGGASVFARASNTANDQRARRLGQKPRRSQHRASWGPRTRGEVDGARAGFDGRAGP
jgi:hypothetical protein